MSKLIEVDSKENRSSNFKCTLIIALMRNWFLKCKHIQIVLCQWHDYLFFHLGNEINVCIQFVIVTDCFKRRHILKKKIRGERGCVHRQILNYWPKTNEKKKINVVRFYWNILSIWDQFGPVLMAKILVFFSLFSAKCFSGIGPYFKKKIDFLQFLTFFANNSNFNL